MVGYSAARGALTPPNHEIRFSAGAALGALSGLSRDGAGGDLWSREIGAMAS